MSTSHGLEFLGEPCLAPVWSPMTWMSPEQPWQCLRTHPKPVSVSWTWGWALGPGSYQGPGRGTQGRVLKPSRTLTIQPPDLCGKLWGLGHLGIVGSTQKMGV